MDTYARLNKWLLAQSPHTSAFQVAFVQIEEILGLMLPPTARRNPAWWANNPDHHSQARAWLEAGFMADNVNLDAEMLVFRRVAVSPK
ncbi:hypothetical protein FTO74_09045 [Granulicella sp. WH15]|uniref:DUF7662 domain-containing protein n=1 Tax=Granulicella sp. WH15 TaxID=2602070 RepID=UPI001366ED88|nr:hypothetical protein [Granulicella sp. WH15]QHN03497.1 hypothetical protein FTO74_09045 [Granulicella sp. WH15]